MNFINSLMLAWNSLTHVLFKKCTVLYLTLTQACSRRLQASGIRRRVNWHLPLPVYRDFFRTWPESFGPQLWPVFVRLSKGHCHCDRQSSCCHRLLNLPDTRRTVQRWQSVGRSTLYLTSYPQACNLFEWATSWTVRVSNPGKDVIFFFVPKTPERHWGPHSALFYGYRSSFSGVERLGLNSDHSPLSSHVVTQVIEALRHKPAGRRLDSLSYQWNFSLT